MNNLAQIMNLAPEEINLTDPCLFWAREPDEDFIRNIENFGQVEPVLVMASPCGKILVAGFKRVMALKSLGRKVLALEIPPADSRSKGLIYLFTNQGQALDQAMIISCLRYFYGLGNISEHVWKLLGIAPGSKIQGLWQSWLYLTPDWDRLLAENNICLECSQILEHTGQSDLPLVRLFFTELSWSRGNSLNLLTWLTEKARMDRVPLSSIIEKLKLEQVLHSRLSPNDKTKIILKKVFQARYPVLSQLKNDLVKRLGNISAGSRWRMEHKDEFESLQIQISTNINSKKDLEKALSQLEQIARSGVFNDWPVR